MVVPLDTWSLGVLAHLKKKGNATIRELQKTIKETLGDVSTDTINKRENALEQGAFFDRTIRVAYEKLGYDGKALVLIKTDILSPMLRRALLNKLEEQTLVFSILECEAEFDVVLLLRFQNVNDYLNFVSVLRNKIGLVVKSSLVTQMKDQEYARLIDLALQRSIGPSTIAEIAPTQ